MDITQIIEAEQRTELPVYTKLAIAPARGEGCWVTTESGERYLDLYGGHAVCLTGHCHPRVVEAIQAQAGALIFYSNAVRSRVRAEASEVLLRHAPMEGARVFYVNSGTEANETALKVARKGTGRRVVVSFTGGFHGRTIGSLAACGIASYRKTADPLELSTEHRIVAFGDEQALAEAVRDDTAAVLLEPVQSIGGVRVASDGFYRACRRVTEEAGAALIFDEIQTGLGRTGAWFFGDPLEVRPDIITLAKGIASGVPCGAVVCAGWLAERQAGSDQGSTFGGGPLAMAAMRATIEVIESEGLIERAAELGALVHEKIGALEGVVEVRGRGLLLGIELDRPTPAVQAALLERGIIVGGNSHPQTMRLLPPLTLEVAHVEQLASVLGAILDEGIGRAPSPDPA